jgi:ribosome biogenesis SPOUT family RNA methylase Rps3
MGVEVLFPPLGREPVSRGGGGICLLDPRAERELCPEDGDVFAGFLFGGILGMCCVFFYDYSVWLID